MSVRGESPQLAWALPREPLVRGAAVAGGEEAAAGEADEGMIQLRLVKGFGCERQADRPPRAEAAARPPIGSQVGDQDLFRGGGEHVGAAAPIGGELGVPGETGESNRAGAAEAAVGTAVGEESKDHVTEVALRRATFTADQDPAARVDRHRLGDEPISPVRVRDPAGAEPGDGREWGGRGGGADGQAEETGDQDRRPSSLRLASSHHGPR